MNANQIYAGEEYAWYQNKPKGYTPSGAVKVKVLSVSKRRNSWQKNASTEVEIEVLELGTSPYSYHKVGQTRTVPARDILDFWDDYEDEMEMKREEERLRKIRQAEEAKAREEERRRRQTRILVLQEKVGSKLVERGLPYGSVSLLGDKTVSMPLDNLLVWLGITDAEIDAAVDLVLADTAEAAVDGAGDLATSGNG